MTKKIKARTAVNEGWKAPKKRKPMTPEQRVAAAERLEKARAAKTPAKNESIHPSVLALDDENMLSVKNVKSWIKTQKELMTTLRNEVRRDVKGAKAKLADADGYIRHMRQYLKHGDWCNDFYGHYEDNKIKWQKIVPK